MSNYYEDDGTPVNYLQDEPPCDEDCESCYPPQVDEIVRLNRIIDGLRKDNDTLREYDANRIAFRPGEENKILFIKALRMSFPELSLKACKDLVDPLLANAKIKAAEQKRRREEAAAAATKVTEILSVIKDSGLTNTDLINRIKYIITDAQF